MKNTSWFGKQRASVQVAVVGGLLAVLGGVLTGAAQIISAEIGKPIAVGAIAPTPSSSPSALLPVVSSSSETRSPGAGSPSPSLSPAPASPAIEAYVTIALGVQSEQLKVTLYFGQLKSIIDLLQGYVAFNTDPALLSSDPERCAETVVFAYVADSSGIVAARGFGQGWGAAEFAPSRTVSGPDRNLHQQILTPPSGATSGGVWDGYDELIAGSEDISSVPYQLSLVSRNGNSWTWLINQQNEVTCSS
jgi:hypothetical protein